MVNMKGIAAVAEARASAHECHCRFPSYLSRRRTSTVHLRRDLQDPALQRVRSSPAFTRRIVYEAAHNRSTSLTFAAVSFEKTDNAACNDRHHALTRPKGNAGKE
eukprot:1460314-Amphidinium_carterae.2